MVSMILLLLRLVGGRGAGGVLVDVGNRVELPHTTLGAIPGLAENRRGTLGTDEVVDAGLELGERILHVRALRESGAQEGGVQGDKDPGAALEEDSGQQQAHPQENLEPRDYRHGHVVVLLDKSADGVSQRVARIPRLAVRGSLGGGDDLRGYDGGDDVGTGICGDVEDGIDAVGKHGEGVLRHEEPDNGHGWEVKTRLANCQSCHVFVKLRHTRNIPRYWIFSSDR